MRLPEIIIASLCSAAVGAGVALAILTQGTQRPAQPYPSEVMGEIRAALTRIQNVEKSILQRLNESSAGRIPESPNRRPAQLRAAHSDEGTSTEDAGTISGVDAALLERIRELIATQGPIGSTEEARQLANLPRNPTNQPALKRFLDNGSDSRRDLMYTSVDEVVNRFGFPDKATQEDNHLVWQYELPKDAEGLTRGLYLKIMRNRVVHAIASRR